MSEQPIPLTDTERRIERILAGDPGLLDEGPVDGFGRPLTRDEQQRLMAALVADVRAAALAPIQALAAKARWDAHGITAQPLSFDEGVATGVKTLVAELDAALAAAGVDAAPNETTTCICRDVPPEMWTTHYGAVDPATTKKPDPGCPVHFRAAVPSGHEQEGGQHG